MDVKFIYKERVDYKIEVRFTYKRFIYLRKNN